MSRIRWKPKGDNIRKGFLAAVQFGLGERTMKRELYYNGKILTMQGQETAEAVLVEDGVILAVGREEEMNLPGDVRRISLEGHTMLPGFIDTHSHFMGCATSCLQCSVQDAGNIQELQETIRTYIRERKLPAGDWVMVRDFAPEQLKEKRMPDRWMLDQASPDHPLVLQHKSGHVGVFNSLGLRELKIDGATQDPVGGHIEKKDGEATGYMEENAFFQAQRRLPMPSMQAMLDACQRAQELYASFGITTLQEGMLTAEMLPMYRGLLRRKALWLDVAGYADISQADQIYGNLPDCDGTYACRFKLGGYKIFLDGSPQSRTAWVRQPYEGSQETGTSTMTDQEVREAVMLSFQTGRQLLAHCNGDRAAQQYLEACEWAAAKGKGPSRPVMIHAQMLGKDQIPRLKPLGMIPSFFAAHVFHWGDVHIQNLGLARASGISLLRSALEAGLVFTMHQDSPVIPPDMLETVWCAAARKTKGGILLGADERISVYEALKAVTCSGAYQYFEENRKGRIAPGMLADFAILDRNPLEAAVEELTQIQVLETIKEGKSIFRKEEQQK